MSPPQRAQRRRSSAAGSIWALLQKYAGPVLRWSVPALALSTGYVVYGIYSGQLTSAVAPRVVENLHLSGKIMAASAGVSAICLIVMTIDEVAYAILLGIGGLAYLLGTPFLISNHIQATTSPAAEAIATWGTIAGGIVILVVGVRIVYEIGKQLASGGLRVKGAKEKKAELRPAEKAKIKKIGPFTPCWEMPFCHESIKEMCPAYKAHKTCWRFGRGCNCDPGLIESLIRAGGVGASGDSHQRRVQQEYIRSDLEAFTPTQRERTIPCSKCPIYMEHQRAKFRFINPILVVGLIVALIVCYRPLLTLYSLTLTGMANFASRFTYGEHVDPRVWFDYLNGPTVQFFFLLFFALLVLSWLLKLTEWVILVKKW